MSLSMWMVHFRPRTPRLVAIGQPIIGADVAIGVPLVQYSKGELANCYPVYLWHAVI